MGFELFIGGRYLRAKQKQAFISLITILSDCRGGGGSNGPDRGYSGDGRF